MFTSTPRTYAVESHSNTIYLISIFSHSLLSSLLLLFSNFERTIDLGIASKTMMEGKSSVADYYMIEPCAAWDYGIEICTSSVRLSDCCIGSDDAAFCIV